MDKYSLIILLTIIQYTLDSSRISCQTIKSKLLLLFHHLIAIYIYIGGLLFDPLRHLVFCSIILIHWLHYGRCSYTVMTNDLCNLPHKRPFNDFIHMIKLNKIHPKIHFLLIIIIISIDIYKLIM